MMTTT